MKHILTFSIILLCISAQAQTTGKIDPDKSYTNQNDFSVFYMPKSKVIEFMDMKTRLEFDSIRIEKYIELTANYNSRIAMSDSAIQLKKLEAEFWYNKLKANDSELLEQKKLNITLAAEKNRIMRSRVYFFVAGIVCTSLVLGFK